MKVREVHTSDSDRRSAQVFFDALLAFWDFRAGSALDAFARNGQLTVQNYSNMVERVTAWELGEEHRPSLEKFNLYDLEFGDSYRLADEYQGDPFNLVVIDTPQGAHKDSYGNVHFEHFDFIKVALKKLASRKCVLVLYVNKDPYDKNEVGSHGYDEYEEYDFAAWMAARQEVYGTTGNQVTEGEALTAYRRLVHWCGYKTNSVLMVPCFSDVPGRKPYAFRIALEVERED